MLSMQNGETMSTGPIYGHRQTQSFAIKPSTSPDENGHSHGSFHHAQPSLGGYGNRHPNRNSIQPINTGRMASQSYGIQDMQTPQTGYDMNFTPLLPTNLLMGSPFQPGSPTTFQSPQFQSFPQQNNVRGHQSQMSRAFQHQQPVLSPGAYQTLGSPTPLQNSSYFGGIQSPTTGFNALTGAHLGGYGAPMHGMNHGIVSGTSRTVYLGNIPPETSAEEILGHVRSGQIESVRLLPDKNCAFISFLDASSATHFHSDAILKKLSIKGQDIKIGWGKPSSVPTSVALAVQQSGASRNVYLGNLGEDVTEEELREDLSKFGPIDTVKIVREKAIGFVHFLSIGNAIKAVTQLPQEPKWQAPRRVYYGKDRCAYVSKTQQQNAAQYLGIAPGYAHVLNGADRDLITNALAQQSVAAAAVATTAGGVNNLGNRTVYLGNIHPETTIEEICNVVRGGLLHHIRYIPDKHICFVTFIDPTSAASFYALSNLQGLMIHNRRLKIGWGKHSGALPPAVALAVSGGASRNVYIGNLDESWTEDRLRQDFQEYGEIELVNTLREKSCAFVNFTNIANAIKAIEAVRGKEEYKRFKVNFGKDRCGNPPRQLINQQHLQQQQQSSENGVGSPSPVNGLAPHSHRAQHSVSPASSGPSHGGYNPLQGPTASTIFNTGTNNPLTLYLAATQQSAQAAAEQQAQQAAQLQRSLSPSDYGVPASYQQSQPASATHLSNQQAFYSSPNEVAATRSAGLEPPSQNHFGHGSHQSVNITNGMQAMNSYSNQASLSSASRSAHSRAVSLPAFSLQAAQQSQQQQPLSGLGYSGEGYGLGVSPGLPGWAEEEVA
ncbi:Putative RNA recognition motif domain, nucleotide-binding alpha-beta plait domain superfamily [Septoria linicola]|uniref:RNA recognition motif domain, nucleotide-binding alpha-beta plait domain superfamily n=1 Tax=Septoria linicola TaxID=215465 RepID=A0A9Q9ANP4_9PEZI|nr:putative RNA recognition motif domain, nucleotide-binding alpha-beta plait domain superfamily [Septoria linicola]USW52310.1 Putative RNA recognition motif domain, nucleotide-binding alpha-beta plait domain superfamily [Septoria linicola]